MKCAVYDPGTGKIFQFIIGPPEMVESYLEEGKEIYLNCPDAATHIVNNEPVTIISPEQITAALVAAVQRHLDAAARSRNYDGILSLCSYAASSDAVFAAEGQAGVAWRDACWRYVYQVQADIVAAVRTVPTPEELVAELPSMAWP
jgi:hypothetical protein